VNWVTKKEEEEDSDKVELLYPRPRTRKHKTMVSGMNLRDGITAKRPKSKWRSKAEIHGQLEVVSCGPGGSGRSKNAGPCSDVVQGRGMVLFLCICGESFVCFSCSVHIKIL
jgi:hypothetical protein